MTKKNIFYILHFNTPPPRRGSLGLTVRILLVTKKNLLVKLLLVTKRNLLVKLPLVTKINLLMKLFLVTGRYISC